MEETKRHFTLLIAVFILASCGEAGEPLPEEENEVIQKSGDQIIIRETFSAPPELDIKMKTKFRLKYPESKDIQSSLGLTKKTPNPACPKNLDTALLLGGNHKPQTEECPPLACKEASFETLSKCVNIANEKIASEEIEEIEAASFVDQCLKNEILAENSFKKPDPFVSCVKEVEQKLIVGEIDLNSADLSMLSCLANQNSFCKYEEETGIYKPGLSCVEKIEAMESGQENLVAQVLNSCLQESKVTNCKVFDLDEGEQ